MLVWIFVLMFPPVEREAGFLLVVAWREGKKSTTKVQTKYVEMGFRSAITTVLPAAAPRSAYCSESCDGLLPFPRHALQIRRAPADLAINGTLF